ncbi:hypothetical protein CBL_03411 [Carabus blaptoides fortunei]
MFRGHVCAVCQRMLWGHVHRKKCCSPFEQLPFIILSHEVRPLGQDTPTESARGPHGDNQEVERERLLNEHTAATSFPATFKCIHAYTNLLTGSVTALSALHWKCYGFPVLEL